MLILAGVSISAIVGEAGILTKAMMASKQQKIAADLESLNMELTGLNTDLIVGNKDNFTTDEIVEYLVNANVLDDAKRSETGNILGGIDMETGEKFFFGVKGENTYKINIGRDGILTASNSTTATGGEVTGGTIIVSNKDFNTDSENEEDKGKFTITSDSEVLFMDTISGDLSIYVQSGVHAKVGIYADMTLTNQNLARSAIDIETGGILDLYVAEGVTVTVNSGFGYTGGNAVLSGGNLGVVAKGGNGGYAGIHVPEDSNLNLFGTGILITYGGDAGDGGIGGGNMGSGGGGGAGAGIGGNGGIGGDSHSTESPNSIILTDCGKDGGNGENCGTINIKEALTIYAYGGAGGSGGSSGSSSGGGAGGYPAAGIGGGGAGGGGATHDAGAGGFSGGRTEGSSGIEGVNGLGSVHTGNGMYSGGGGYYTSGKGNAQIHYGFSYVGGEGSSYACEPYYSDYSGSGGTAGKGGNIFVNKSAKIYAYNGDMITNGIYNQDYFVYDKNGNMLTDKLNVIEKKNGNKLIPAIIYAQMGISRKVYYGNYMTANSLSELKNVLYKDEENIEILNYINLQINNNQGIGSGAGYIEISNGTYTVDSSMN